jgi:hypothetical protein
MVSADYRPTVRALANMPRLPGSPIPNTVTITGGGVPYSALIATHFFPAYSL